MHKKFLSCLLGILLFAASFLLTGFTEAALLPQQFLSTGSNAPAESAFSEKTISFIGTSVAEEDSERAVFRLQPAVDVFAVIPNASGRCGQSELIRRFPVALLHLYGLQFSHRQFQEAFSPISPTYLSTVPGLPVLLRTLRL